MGILFKINNLSKSFKVNDEKTLSILNDISFELTDKGLFCIYGKSGCGKSTLLNILQGLMKPSKGEVIYQGNDISQFKEEELNNYLCNEIGVVFQSYNLINNFTLFDNIKLATKIKGIDVDNEINNLLLRFNLTHLKNKKVSKLSGGEKQRVAIIRAIITHPKVIFADEPTGNLDNANAIIIMDIFKELSKECLIVLVSHNKELVNKYKDGFLDLTNGTKFNYSPIEVKSDDIINKDKKKRKKNNFLSFMLFRSLKENFIKNFFSFLALSFSFLVILFSIAFNEGILKNAQSLVYNFQNYNSFKISKITNQMIGDSILSLEEVERPSKEDINVIKKDFKNSEIAYSLDYFFGTTKNVKINNQIIENVTLIPVNNIPKGNVVYVNNSFKDAYSKLVVGSCLNRFARVDLGLSYFYNDFTSIEDNIIEEKFIASLNFDIEKIKYEFCYLNSPKMYFSYEYFIEFLQKYPCPKISKLLKTELTFFDLLERAKTSEEISGYSYILFLDNREDCELLNSKLTEYKGFKIINDPSIVVTSFINLSNALFKGIILFIIISIICSISIVGFLTFSSFISNRKRSAIFTILGAKNESIYYLYIVEELLMALLAFIFSFFIFVPLENRLNIVVFNNIYFDNLFNYPIRNNFMNISILIVIIVFVFMVSYIPLVFSKKKEIYRELKEE